MLTRPVAEELESDRTELAAWMAELRRVGLLGQHEDDPEQIVLALYRYLGRTPSRLLGVALTDAVGDRRTQNQPGTTDEYPNWRVPLTGPDGKPMMLEDVFTSRRAAALADAVRKHAGSANQPAGRLLASGAMTLSANDRSALSDLVHRYAAGVDDRQFESVAALFAIEAELMVPEPPATLTPIHTHRGRPAIARAVAAVAAVARTEHAIVGRCTTAGRVPAQRAAGSRASRIIGLAAMTRCSTRLGICATTMSTSRWTRGGGSRAGC